MPQTVPTACALPRLSRYLSASPSGGRFRFDSVSLQRPMPLRTVAPAYDVIRGPRVHELRRSLEVHLRLMSASSWSKTRFRGTKVIANTPSPPTEASGQTPRITGPARPRSTPSFAPSKRSSTLTLTRPRPPEFSGRPTRVREERTNVDATHFARWMYSSRRRRNISIATEPGETGIPTLRLAVS